MPPTSNSITNNLPGLGLLIMIVAVPLAFLASLALFSFYRRAALRVMRSRAAVILLAGLGDRNLNHVLSNAAGGNPNRSPEKGNYASTLSPID